MSPHHFQAVICYYFLFFGFPASPCILHCVLAVSFYGISSCEMNPNNRMLQLVGCSSAPSLNASPSGRTSLTKILQFLSASMCTANPTGRTRIRGRLIGSRDVHWTQIDGKSSESGADSPKSPVPFGRIMCSVNTLTGTPSS